MALVIILISNLKTTNYFFYLVTNDTSFSNSDDFTTKITKTAALNETNNERAIGHVRSIFKTIEQHIKGNNNDLPPSNPPPPVPSFDKQNVNTNSSTMFITPNYFSQTNAYLQTQTYSKYKFNLK